MAVVDEAHLVSKVLCVDTQRKKIRKLELKVLCDPLLHILDEGTVRWRECEDVFEVFLPLFLQHTRYQLTSVKTNHLSFANALEREEPKSGDDLWQKLVVFLLSLLDEKLWPSLESDL